MTTSRQAAEEVFEILERALGPNAEYTLSMSGPVIFMSRAGYTYQVGVVSVPDAYLISDDKRG